MVNPQLLEEMKRRFNLSDLNVICFDLGWRHEDFPRTLTDKIIAMIEYAQQTNSLTWFLQECKSVNDAFNYRV